jgi:ABC-type transporter Mla subunit MlaD
MKNRMSFPIAISAVCFCLICFGCNSSDLKLNMMVDDASGLREESPIYMVQPGGNTQVGTVDKLEAADGGTLLSLVIDREYRGKIREDAVFMVNRAILSVDPPSILVDPLESGPETPAMASGTIVNEISFVKYSLLLAANAMNDTFNEVMKEAQRFLEGIGRQVDSDLDALQEELSLFQDEIGSFTDAQKKRFKTEVLPGLKQTMDDLLRQFDDDSRYEEKREQLEKEMRRLTNTLQT